MRILRCTLLLALSCPAALAGQIRYSASLDVMGGTKLATLSTGAKVNVPLFINEGDIVRINTDSGDYAERVRKS